MAPFWRGLNDYDEQWAEHQIIAAVRGLPIPLAEERPPAEPVPRPLSSPTSPSDSTQNVNNLTVPMGPRTQSVASDRSASNVGSALVSSTSTGNKGSSSPFKPRTKALAAALSLGSKNGSTADLAPREIKLPDDPFVNGQPLEVFLYKEGGECPICFLYYPPYLNHTRCCDQPICSECFVQIKRPDPHFPEGHGDQENPNPDPEEEAGLLISEPAQCPYCQQPEFGVTYEAPPFRRGLTYAISPVGVGLMNTAMSSSSSLSSGLSPAPLTPPPPSGVSVSRRRTQSLSANAPNVITTDRVRPDWAAKLAAQRNHLARRAAAATALHTAAFLMGDSSSRGFSRISRFGRRNTNNDSSNTADSGVAASPSVGGASSGPEPGPRSSSGRGQPTGTAEDQRQSHMDNLENMMLAEAIRLSLAAEDERKRKAEKEERKEAKKKEKEERKAAKAAAKGHPYSGTGQSSTSGSTLSLPGIGAIGRRRGNSAASNLRVEATTAHAMASAGSPTSSPGPATATSPTDKGKGVDRGPPQTPPETEIGQSNVDALHPDKAPTSVPAPPPTSSPRPVPSPHQPAGPSHLRQMSSASSASSSQPDSQSGSYQNTPGELQPQQDPHGSGLSLGSRSDVSEEGGAGQSGEQDNEPSTSTEPMFNYRSLAEMVGVEMDGVNAGRRLSQIGESHAEDESETAAILPAERDNDSSSSTDKARAEEVEDLSESISKAEDNEDGKLSKSIMTLTQDSFDTKGEVTHAECSEEAPPRDAAMETPQLMVTPETPVPEDDDGKDFGRLGFRGTSTVELSGEVTR